MSIYIDLFKRLKKEGFPASEIPKLIDELINEDSNESVFDKVSSDLEAIDTIYPSKGNGFFAINKKMTKNGVKETEDPEYEELSRYLMDEFHLKCDDSLIYLWNEKYYKSISPMGMKQKVDKLIKKNKKPFVTEEFTKKALIKAYVDMNSLIEVKGYLNCNNGLLNVRSGELKPHDPKKFIKYVLDHDYDPNVKCPTFMRSLDLVTNGDKDLQRLIKQVFGYCIAGGNPIAHKAFMFYGDGGNGKSTILTALSNLVGSVNAARIPLTFFDKPFSMISLDGKLVNLIDETPKFNINPEAFKNVVSGGYVRAAHKGKPEIDLKINARIIFACNKLPNFKDDSDGMLRRLVIIPFNHKISSDEMDKKIDDKIVKEMSGVLNFAIEGLKDLMQCDYNFHNSKANDEAMEQYKEETDTSYAFVKEHVLFQKDLLYGEPAYLESTNIYKAYRSYCHDYGYQAVSERKFALRAMKYFKTICAKHKTELTDAKRQKKGKKRGVTHFVFSSEYQNYQ